MTNDDRETVLQEQQTYYNARAAEYDQWWTRVGRYDQGAEENGIWFSEQDEVAAAFATLKWQGDIVELAGGTGIWTEWLAPRVRSITVLDGSLEMIAINSARLDAGGFRGKMHYEQIDLFEWEPDEQFDGLFMGYFLSHVPAADLDRFLEKIGRALRPGGVFAMLDGRRDVRSSSPDQPPPGPETEVMTRRLNDGRTYQIVKRYDEPEDLAARLAQVGVDAEVRTTAVHFLYATGKKR